MVELGFRPPQFSEDLAWVPAWLQPNNQLEDSYDYDNQVEEAQDNPISSKQDMSLKGDGCEGLNPLAEDCALGDFHLVLTGEENSAASLSAPSGNVPHLHLYLSTCSISQDTNDLIPSMSQMCSIPYLDFGGHSIDNVIGARAIGQSERNRKCNSGIPKSVKNDRGKAMELECKNTKLRYREGFDMNFFKADDVEDAIELSIAASEALVIHEMAKKDSDAEDSLLAAVLELSLRVKQARVGRFKDASPDRIGQTDYNDSLSDLDDAAMEETLEDVGLKLSGSSCHLTQSSVILPVQDALAPEYCSTDVPEANFCENPTQGKSVEILVINDQLSKGVHLKTDTSELPDRKSSEKTFVLKDVHLETKMSELSRNIHTTQETTCSSPEFHLLPQESIDVMIAKLGNSNVDVTTSQHEGGIKTPPRKLGNSGENEELQLASNCYTSRWFGGWGKKESKYLMQHSEVDPRMTFKFFVGETSTLSESADLAQDENSIIQGQENGADKLSQLSKSTKGLSNADKDGQLLSQDIVGSTSLSPSDPLCSFVPCSITSADGDSSLGHNKYEREVNIGECDVSSLNQLLENSNTNVEHVDLDIEILSPGFNGHSLTTAKKGVTALKAYSMLFPKNNPLSNGEGICSSRPLLTQCNHNLHVVDQDRVYNKSSTNKGPGNSLLLKSASSFASKCNAHSTTVTQTGCDHEVAIDEGEKLFDPRNRKMLPVIFDCQSRSDFQASEPFIDDLTHKKVSDPVPGAQALPKLQKNKDFQTILSEYNTNKVSRKRVHFADAAVELQHITEQTGPKISQKYRSSTRASKRARRSYPLKESRNHGEKWHSRTSTYKKKERLILRGFEFLLTGFSSEKRTNIEDLIRKYGGVVLQDIPPPPSTRTKKSSRYILPVILCSKKLQTTTFLYGCAVNAFILRADWLFDSVAEGSVQSSAEYMIIKNRPPEECSQLGIPVRITKQQYIFDGVGIMLHGSNGFCSKFEKLIKHGGGKVFKTLRGLVCSFDAARVSVAALVIQYEAKPLRHLTHFASEKKIPVTSCSWIVGSLHKGKLLPLKEMHYSSSPARPKIQKILTNIESSQEI